MFQNRHFELENGVMTTPKRRSILSLILLAYVKLIAIFQEGLLCDNSRS